MMETVKQQQKLEPSGGRKSLRVFVFNRIYVVGKTDERATDGVRNF